ncbi:DMT family transporter [Planctomyces sp. SH-PL62]|uniref:DMT family transporter n=1 Tax=Planctomyces sp. SH-PL62 TaxID=1636152 RepID=UPI00078D8C4F|nr:DMT family transporter [Planctomyces sp. SH-PL62]AMV38942.1 EamA-like transporter family protein [Planctomyces sp. SH-PL62]
MSQRTNSLLPAAWMISAALCFASMGAMTHAVGSRCDWLLIAFIRIFCTFVFSVALALLGGARLVFWKPPTLWWRSIAGTISVACTFYALTRLPVADVLTLTNTYPLWIVLTTFFKGGGGGRLTDLACVVCGVFGVAVIQQPHGAGGGDSGAVLIALVASVTTAIAMLGLHRLKDVDARAVVAHFSGLASLSLALWLLFAHPLASADIPRDIGPIALLLGVGISGTLGQVLLTKAYASGPPAKIAVLSLTQVLFGLVFDVTLQGRRLTPSSLLGFAMVLGPTAWVTSRAARRPRPGSDLEMELEVATELETDRPIAGGVEPTAPKPSVGT